MRMLVTRKFALSEGSCGWGHTGETPAVFEDLPHVQFLEGEQIEYAEGPGILEVTITKHGEGNQYVFDRGNFFSMIGERCLRFTNPLDLAHALSDIH